MCDHISCLWVKIPHDEYDGSDSGASEARNFQFSKCEITKAKKLCGNVSKKSIATQFVEYRNFVSCPGKRLPSVL